MALNLTGQRQPKPKVGVVAACAVAPVVTAADVASKTSLVNQNEYSGKQVSSLIVIEATNGNLSIALGKGLDATDKWQPFTMGTAITPAVPAALSFTTNLPATKSGTAGSDVTLDVVVAGGHKPLTFKWLKGTAVVSGATGATLTLASAAAGDSGAYKCVVTDRTGATITSATCTLTVA